MFRVAANRRIINNFGNLLGKQTRRNFSRTNNFNTIRNTFKRGGNSKQCYLFSTAVGLVGISNVEKRRDVVIDRPFTKENKEPRENYVKQELVEETKGFFSKM